MITSKPSLRSGFDRIIRSAPSGSGQTTASQPGYYPLNLPQVVQKKTGAKTSKNLSTSHFFLGRHLCKP